MARWVVPRRWYSEAQIPKRLSTSGAVADEAPAAGEPYLEKLARYVPVEILTPFLVLAALNAGDRQWLLALLAFGFLATPAYHFVISRRGEPSARPKPYFYALSAVAFLAWTLGASPAIISLSGWGALHATTIMILTATLIPALDGILDVLTDRVAPPMRYILGGN
jgi:hypothetical protein